MSESFCSPVKLCTFPGTLIAAIISFRNRSSCISFSTRGSLINFNPWVVKVFFQSIVAPT
jgi:hypothetical protein